MGGRKDPPELDVLSKLQHLRLICIQEQQVAGGDNALDVLQVHQQGFLSAQDGRGVGGGHCRIQNAQVTHLDAQLMCDGQLVSLRAPSKHLSRSPGSRSSDQSHGHAPVLTWWARSVIDDCKS